MTVFLFFSIPWWLVPVFLVLVADDGEHSDP